jgi:hypothetical protein
VPAHCVATVGPSVVVACTMQLLVRCWCRMLLLIACVINWFSFVLQST